MKPVHFAMLVGAGAFSFAGPTAQPGWVWQNSLPTPNDLRSVCFINSDTGTAVGGGGTIWMNQLSVTLDVLNTAFVEVYPV